jgi:pyruvate dehydrogenase E2 component (dihydrolipoamide acetyltransferase)
MVRVISMPKLGQSEEVATIVRWLKKEGDAVAKGDILFEIETDKALLEVESFFEGTLLKIVAAEGQIVPVQATVGYIGDPGEPIPETLAPAEPQPRVEAPRASGEARHAASTVPVMELPQARRGKAAEPQRDIRPGGKPLPTPMAAEPSRFLRISPRAARLAREAVIDPSPIIGTGPGGRIVERDVKAYLAARGYDRLRITPTAKKLAAREKLDILSLEGQGSSGRISVADVQRAIAERPKPMSRMRQVIAERLTQSFASTPHFFVTVSVDMTDLEAFRSELKVRGGSYSVTDFILKSVALALREFPTVNSTTDGKTIRWHSKVHLGLAVSVEQGLVVPVVRDADEMTLAEIHDCATELTAKARAGKLTPAEITGSTFTVSNMGMLDVENFTAIINPGESAILAVSSVQKQPVVRKDRVTIRRVMKMTLSSDHRLIDGALAARFVNAIKSKLEKITLWKGLA